jgi:hypothetical protein
MGLDGPGDDAGRPELAHEFLHQRVAVNDLLGLALPPLLGGCAAR